MLGLWEPKWPGAEMMNKAEETGQERVKGVGVQAPAEDQEEISR